ncbi:MAG: hypothetical protein R2727_05470 [Bacteroidales bacterium]
MNPELAAVSFRLACGLPVKERYVKVNEFIKKRGEDSFPVLGEPLSDENVLVLDLSVSSSMIGGDSRKTVSLRTRKIEEAIENSGKSIGWGVQ